MTKLDRTWRNCLRMWKWVSENYDGEVPMSQMKYKWLKENRFTKPIHGDCFFCDFAKDDPRDTGCHKCPGRLVSPRFTCTAVTYSYVTKTKKFYKKLLELDAKRKR